MKKIFRLSLVFALSVLMVSPSLADTIRLKDGSVIRGQVVGFKDQQFTVLIGGGSKGRRGRTTVYVEDVESIEFDSNTAVGTAPADNANNGWTNTGLVVRKGQRLRINASGRVSLGRGRFSTPMGISTISDNDKLMRTEPTGALIAV